MSWGRDKVLVSDERVASRSRNSPSGLKIWRQLLPAFNDLETQTIGICHHQSSPSSNQQIASIQEVSLRTNFCSVWQSVGTIPNLPAKL